MCWHSLQLISQCARVAWIFLWNSHIFWYSNTIVILWKTNVHNFARFCISEEEKQLLWNKQWFECHRWIRCIESSISHKTQLIRFLCYVNIHEMHICLHGTVHGVEWWNDETSHIFNGFGKRKIELCSFVQWLPGRDVSLTQFLIQQLKLKGQIDVVCSGIYDQLFPIYWKTFSTFCISQVFAVGENAMWLIRINLLESDAIGILIINGYR